MKHSLPENCWFICAVPVITLFREHYSVLVDLLCSDTDEAGMWLPAQSENPIRVDLRKNWPLKSLEEPFWVVFGRQRGDFTLDRSAIPFWGRVTRESPLDHRQESLFIDQLAESFDWAIIPHIVEEYVDYYFLVVRNGETCKRIRDSFYRNDRHAAGERRNLVLTAHELKRSFSQVCSTVMFAQMNERDSWIATFVSGRLQDIVVIAPTRTWAESYVSLDVPEPWPDWLLRECDISNEALIPILGLECQEIELAAYFPRTVRAFNAIGRLVPRRSELFLVVTERAQGDFNAWADIYSDLTATGGSLLPELSSAVSWLYWRHEHGWEGSFEVLTCRDNAPIQKLLHASTVPRSTIRVCAMF